MPNPTRLQISATSLLIVFAMILSACGNGGGTPPPVSAVFNPKVTAEFDVDGWAWAERPDHVISPGGEYALAVLNDEGGQTVAILPLEGEEHLPLALYEAPSGWVEQGSLYYRTLGWTDTGDPLFVASGYQNQGPNVGKRGIAICQGDIEKESATEIGFIDLPQGELHTATYIPEEDKIFIAVSAAVLSYDLASKEVSVIKADLPIYDGLFYARLSPDGMNFVYELVEEGRSGVYILNASSGSETALLPNGETMSFIPQWSPDGKYIAAYTVGRIEGEEGNTRQDYDYFPGEDGPMTIAPTITVVDTSGEVIQTISIEGKILSNMKWSGDSKSLAFVTGDKTSIESSYLDMGIPNIPWDGVWTASINGSDSPARIASLTPPTSQEPSFVYPLAFDVADTGVYFQYGDAENISVWYASPGKGAGSETPLAPIKVADGYWHFQYSNPVFGEYTGGLIASDTYTMTELWFLGPELRKMDSWGTATTMILGFNDDTVLLFRRGESNPATISVISVYD